MIRKPRIDKFGRVHPPERIVPVRVLVAIAVLLAISLGARQWLHRFVTSVERYEPPAMPQIAAGAGTTPVAQSAILVIASGLRDDVSHEMPMLENLRQRGAQAQVRVPWPTPPHTAWTTLLSGATPELSGAVALNPSGDEPRPITVDHLLRRARVTRHTTVLAGHKSWESMIPAATLTEAVFSTGRTAKDDDHLVQQAVDILAARQPNLTVVHLSQVDTAGHAHGGTSGEYYRAAQRTDERIRRLMSAVDLRSTVVAITSDHGHSDQGGHSGSETVVTTVPLIIAGPGVKPGDYGTIDQIHIAPTLSALMGLPIPAESQGTIRFEMLDMSAPLRAEKALALAEQQARLSAAYLRAIDHFDYAQYKRGAASGVPAQTLSVARSAWDIGNVQGAFDIARQSDQDARQAMAAGRTDRITDERRERLPIVLGVGAVFAVGLAWVLSLRTAWLLGAGLLAWLGPLGNAGALTSAPSTGSGHSLDLPAMRWSPAVMGAALALAAVIWARRSGRQEHRLVAGVALGAGLLFAGLQPSTVAGLQTVPPPSAIADTEALRSALIWQSIAALLIGGGAVLSLVWPTEQNWRAIAWTSYCFVFLLTAGLILELAVGYWLHGLTVTWYLPDPKLASWHVTGLMQTTFVAGLGIFLPAVVILAILGLRRQWEGSPASSHTQSPEAGGVRP